jgi:hypothetical protein
MSSELSNTLIYINENSHRLTSLDSLKEVEKIMDSEDKYYIDCLNVIIKKAYKEQVKEFWKIYYRYTSRLDGGPGTYPPFD